MSRKKCTNIFLKEIIVDMSGDDSEINIIYQKALSGEYLGRILQTKNFDFLLLLVIIVLCKKKTNLHFENLFASSLTLAFMGIYVPRLFTVLHIENRP